jgi:hypothetical protein
MAKKTKKMAFGGLTGALGSHQPSLQMAPPIAAPMPVGNKLGFAQSAINTMNANAAKYPGMAAPAGVGPGMAPMPGAVRVPMKKGGAVKAKKMASGGKVSQLAKANGIAVRGKSRGRIC